MVSCSSIFLLVFGFGVAFEFHNALVIQSNAVVPLSDGGRDVDPNGIARSVVQIVENGQTVCTGSIIDSFTVVTAKHCFEDEKGNLLSTRDYEFEVVYGTVQRYDPDNEGNFRRISILDDDIHHHESKYVDVTVLSLFTEMIGAVRMELDKQSSIQCEMPLQIYGFGDLDGAGSIARVMQVLDTVVVSGCGGEVKDFSYDGFITQADGKTTCGGDSGGPVISIQSGQMVGIHLRGGIIDTTCRPGELNFHIKVSKVMDFISTYCIQC